jgi:hypothetical protein
MVNPMAFDPSMVVSPNGSTAELGTCRSPVLAAALAKSWAELGEGTERDVPQWGALKQFFENPIQRYTTYTT